MKKLSKNNRGFSAVEALIVLVVLALLGFAGWFVYHKQHEKNDKKTTTNSSSKSTNDTSKDASKDSTKDQTEYFTVSEWGVRAAYTASDRFTYKLSDGNKMLTAISKELAAADSGCSTFGAGQISRMQGSDFATADGQGPGQTVEQAAAQNPNTYVKVGNYYYMFRHSQSACGSVDVATQNKANDQLKALVPTLKAVE